MQSRRSLGTKFVLLLLCGFMLTGSLCGDDSSTPTGTDGGDESAKCTLDSIVTIAHVQTYTNVSSPAYNGDSLVVGKLSSPLFKDTIYAAADHFNATNLGATVSTSVYGTASNQSSAPQFHQHADSGFFYEAEINCVAEASLTGTPLAGYTSSSSANTTVEIYFRRSSGTFHLHIGGDVVFNHSNGEASVEVHRFTAGGWMLQKSQPFIQAGSGTEIYPVAIYVRMDEYPMWRVRLSAKASESKDQSNAGYGESSTAKFQPEIMVITNTSPIWE